MRNYHLVNAKEIKLADFCIFVIKVEPANENAAFAISTNQKSDINDKNNRIFVINWSDFYKHCKIARKSTLQIKYVDVTL